MLIGTKKSISQHHAEITFLKNTNAGLVKIFYSSKQFLSVSLRVKGYGLLQKNLAKPFASVKWVHIDREIRIVPIITH